MSRIAATFGHSVGYRRYIYGHYKWLIKIQQDHFAHRNIVHIITVLLLILKMQLNIYNYYGFS